MTDQRTARILGHLPVAERVAGNFRPAGIPALGADDLLSTATLAIIRAVDDFDGRGDLEGFAGTRARHTVLDELRRMRPGKKHHHADVRILSIQQHATRPPYAGKADGQRSTDDHLDLDAAIGQLSAREGTVIVRHYLQGERLKDIAPDLGCSPARASQIRKRAITRLEKLLS